MKKILFLVVLLMAGLFLVSCNGESGGDTVYKYQGCELTFTDAANFQEEQSIRSLLNSKNINATLTLKADKTYELKNGEVVETGTYEIAAGKITLTSNGKTQEGTIADGKLSFEINGNEYISEKLKKVVFIYTKNQ